MHYYKYIVDGVWKCDESSKKTDDGKGNINNELDLKQYHAKPQYEIGIILKCD